VQISSKMLDEQSKKAIVQAIQLAEAKTSGELRVHFDSKGGTNPFEEAKRIFEQLGMTQTVERNGVLIYLCFPRKQIAILGDKGIYERVPENFWDDTYNTMANAFQKGEYEAGICDAIENIGTNLSRHFPVRSTNPNELSDEITES